MISFIRIPKNASTSVYRFFGEVNLIRNDYLDANNSKYLNIFEPSHCTISEAEKLLGEDVLKYPVLAVVRNPYDRLVSMFFFAKKYNLGSLYNIDMTTFDSFSEGFYKLSHYDDFFHSTSQKEFIKHDKSEDFTVCRFEELKTDLAEFIKDNKLEFDMKDFPVLNSTEHCDYKEYYSDKSKDIVNKMWGDDLDCFSYSFNYDDKNEINRGVTWV